MKKWIALFLAAVCLLSFGGCTQPPIVGSSHQTQDSNPAILPTTTANLPTQETLPPQLVPDSVRPTDYDTQWGQYTGKVFMWEDFYKDLSGKTLSRKYYLQLFADGTFKHLLGGGHISGTWSFEDNILTLYNGMYYEELNYTYYYISYCRYENGVLTIMEGSSEIMCLEGEVGTEYTFTEVIE